MSELLENPDFFLLDQELSAEEIALRDRVRAYGQEHVLPAINAFWERGEHPLPAFKGLADLGVVGTFIEGYGCPGLSRQAAGLVAREMGRIDGSVNTFFGVHSNLCMGSIYMLGNEEQRQRWLPTMAKIETTGAFALTEPTHGSDSVSLETVARRDGDGERRIATRSPATAPLRVAASRSHLDPRTAALLQRIGEHDAIGLGSSLKFCLVATGEADLYPRLGRTMEWDTAAGDAVLRGAGGEVVRFDDHTPLTYGKPGFENPFFIAYAPGVLLHPQG